MFIQGLQDYSNGKLCIYKEISNELENSALTYKLNFGAGYSLYPILVAFVLGMHYYGL